MERARPAAAMIAPRIVTVRQPYLFTKLLAMGPENPIQAHNNGDIYQTALENTNIHFVTVFLF